MNSALRITGAFVAAVGAAALTAYLVVVADFHSGWNLLWMIGFPILATAASVRRLSRWIWPAVLGCLTICWFCALAATAQLLGSG
jgi:hypothetical protein